MSKRQRHGQPLPVRPPTADPYVYDLRMSARLTKAAPDSNEAAIMAAFGRDRLVPHRWSNLPGDTYEPHSHAYRKVLYCLRGSITFHITANAEDIELHPGDRLDIEPHTEHSATVGRQGVECIEATR